MIADYNSENHQPLTWVGRCPIYLSTILAVVYSVAMVLVSIGMMMEATATINLFSFSTADVFGKYAFWQPVTYALVNGPSIWFLLDMYLLVMFGRELEKFYGRRAFVGMYLTMLLLPPAFFIGLGLAGYPTLFAGTMALHFGVFVAFAALYPRAEFFFGIQARWLASALMAIYVLQCVAGHAWTMLAALVLDVGAALVLVNYLSGRLQLLPRLSRVSISPRRLQTSKKTLRLLPKEPEMEEAIDPILDKISREGIASLTSVERARLEHAREALIARERRH